MIPFRTTPKQLETIAGIAQRMLAAGVDAALVDDASLFAAEDQGVHDLMALWDGDENARAAVLVDLAASVRDWGPQKDEEFADAMNYDIYERRTP